MKVQILGVGCSKCRELYAVTQKALEDLKIDAELSKVEDIRQIAAFGIVSTPALAVDGRVVFSGGVPTQEKLGELFQR